MSNRFAIIIVALIIIFGGIFFINKNKADAPNAGGSNAQASKHVKEGSSGVTLTEYADFQCPGCGAYHPVVKQVMEKYAGKVTFQFVNYPLMQIHQNAMAAHRAAEAASKQGKFWEMYDQLYANQTAWSSSSNVSSIFENYATQLGLNKDQFKQDSASGAVNDVINADIAAGRKLNVNATPTFFLNGQKLDQPPQDIDGFSKLLDDAIAAKTKS